MKVMLLFIVMANSDSVDSDVQDVSVDLMANSDSVEDDI